VDSHFTFLSTAQADLLYEILGRRNPALLKRIQLANSVTRPDAEKIMAAISEELNDNLDDDWEPTNNGQSVNAVLAQFNAARVDEWP
jgi:hypothetical protein